MRTSLISLLLTLLVNPILFAAPSTLDLVKKRGHLKCGVSHGLPGFSSIDKSGTWQGIDVDICKAIAAAIFSDASKVNFTPLSSKERFTALQSGEIDVLSRNTTWTISRDLGLGIDFVGVTYFDGQGFMVRKSAGVKSTKELDGATVCVNLGTTTELNLADYFASQKMKYKIVAFEKNDEVVKAYDAGRCDAFSTDHSGLYSMLQILKKPSDHLILPETITKEPLGPAVRQGDAQWSDIVRWVLFAVLEAEELGVNSSNAITSQKSTNPNIQRLLGKEGTFGKQMGLNDDWAFQIVKNVGNYQEIFNRNLGKDSSLKIERGLNKLWRDGGLHYPMPFR